MRVGISGFEPKRLTQVREARGLSKINLGRLVERSPSTITKWESGYHSPDADALTALSIILQCPTSWFTKPVTLYENNPVFFRTLANTAKDLCAASEHYMEWLQEISAHLQEELDFPEVNIPYLDVSDYRQIDDEMIEIMASKCRKLWGLGLAPLADLLLVIENAGVICSRFAQGSTVMDGYSQWNERESRPYIILASDKNNYFRSRFDAAHELGHLVLHRFIKRLDIVNFKPIEAQAHKFAACFMLPEEAFSVELPPGPTLENFITLKQRWGMSAQSMITRAKELLLISDVEHLRLYKQVSARGWRKGEPFDDQNEPEVVRLLPRSLQLLLDEGIFSKQSFIKYLDMSSTDVENLMSLPQGYLSENNVLQLTPKLKSKRNATINDSDEDNVVNMFDDKPR
ncbi:ImmA/IrrE family metallo-endopeptidase [Enterobacteriaceae bacterium RIT702]|nr:ImmA/IrrE family metallo-endopeptidase [Enterobacteriaceae bacterium RIT702]